MPPYLDTMPSGLLTVLLSVAFWVVALLGLRVLARRHYSRKADRIEQELRDADRQLHLRLDARLQQNRFSYRPSSGELVLDARAASLHGLPAPDRHVTHVTVAGWRQLPATARAAGWIDEALRDGLARRQPVRCEYLARSPGRADRHLILTAVPLPRGGMLVGAVAEHPGGDYVDSSGGADEARMRTAGPVRGLQASDDRSWFPMPGASEPL